MAAIPRGKGFFFGALGGLALALLVVGAGALTPQPTNQVATTSQLQIAAGSGTSTSTSTPSSSTPSQPAASYAGVATSGASCSASTPCPPNASNVAGLAVPSTTTTTTASSTMATNSSVVDSLGGQPSVQTTPTRPDSLLTAIPGEGVSTLLGTLSPLLVGLLVAALVYGAYSRRQNS